VSVCGLEALAGSVDVPWNTAFTLCVPGPKIVTNCAVPFEVSCAVPSMAMSSQKLALASQKSTCPGVTGFVPDVTVAVNVRAVPWLTLFDDTAKVVVVGLGAA
jgi:hypothetical protein